MNRLRIPLLLVVLVVVLAGCLPGLGPIQPVAVTVTGEHTAVATFTPTLAVTDVIVNFAGGGITGVQADSPIWQCQEFRNAWDCFVTGQDDSAPPRLVHPAGEPISFTVTAAEPVLVVSSVAFKPH